jgi:cytochrome c553
MCLMKRNNILAISLVLLVLCLPFATLEAAGNAKNGSKKAKPCQVCHGQNGKSTNPTYPMLAGQHAKYIVKQLKAFKAGQRKDPIMNKMAAGLNEQDMEDVAAFFSKK